MTSFHCTNCSAPYPDKLVFRCPKCGGIFDIKEDINLDLGKIEKELPGIWKYRHSFGLPEDAPIISLGEGNTPLVPDNTMEKKVYFKLEYLNPSGSFKDRLTAPEISFLKSFNVSFAVDDSSGNAGASFAAYAARANIQSRVYVPAHSSGPKRAQIEAYGAEVVQVEGPRSAAAEELLKEVEKENLVYASHAFLPFGHPGLATIVYEVVEQLGQEPGSIIAPVGQGSLLLSIIYGMIAMLNGSVIEALPNFYGVQAKLCAPLWQRFNSGVGASSEMNEGNTIAEGVRIKNPIRGDALINLSQTTPLEFLAVEEEDILPGRDQLSNRGFYVEPTSAIVWDGLIQIIETAPEPIVVILTGSGLKSD